MHISVTVDGGSTRVFHDLVIRLHLLRPSSVVLKPLDTMIFYSRKTVLKNDALD